MMRYLTLDEVLLMHQWLLEQSGGMTGIRSIGALESAIAQPLMTFGGADLYASIAEKATALGFSIIKNHPFNDGNKRVGHAVLETFLKLNQYELNALVDDQENVILGVAAGSIDRAQFLDWIEKHLVKSGT